MEENKTEGFSEETEKLYEKLTESAISVPSDFKENVMTQIRAENAAKKKKTWYSFVSAAAVIVIIAGVILIAPNFRKGASSAVSDNASVENSGALPTEEKCDEYFDAEQIADASGSEADASGTSDTSGIPTFTKDGKEYGWNEFVKACENGTLDPLGEEESAYIKKCSFMFGAKGMNEEKQTADALIAFDIEGGNNVPDGDDQ